MSIIMSMMKRSAGTLTAALIAAFAVAAISLGEPATQGINPDLQSALNQANEAGRLLLVDFDAAWCPWCARMNQTLADPSVKAILDKQFFYYNLDIGQFDKHTSCLAQYGIKGIPFIAVFNRDGTVRATQSGYSDAQAFKAFLIKTAGATGH